MSSNDELWGTFAVDDHLRDHAFVAELILFDRLVLPKPPDNDTDEFKRWIELGWRPKELRQIVEALEEFAVPVPWDNQLRTIWNKEYTSLSAEERSAFRIHQARGAQTDFQLIRTVAPDQPAKWVTRGVLADALDPNKDEALYRKIRAIVDIDPTAEIEAVVGYGSFARFREEVPVELAPSIVTLDRTPAFLFRWDFVVPEDTPLSDPELRRRAAELSRKDEFRDSRRQFHDWRRKLIANRVTVETARSEMDRCLAVYNGVVSKARLRTRVLRALQVVAAMAPLADFGAPGVGMVGGVVFGMGALLAECFVPTPTVGTREKFAALVHDGREKFEWHDPRPS